MLEIVHLADYAGWAVLCVVAFAGGCIGVTAVHGHRRRDAIPAVGMRLSLQAPCHRGLGMLYATTGQREQACAALAAAVTLYRDMDMAFWLPETEAALT